MKFAKELDENAVPEWKSKYLDYKAGKKKLKAVQRAIRAVEVKTSPSARLSDRASPFNSLRDAPVRKLLKSNGNSQSSNAPLALQRSRSEAVPLPSTLEFEDEEGGGSLTPQATPVRVHERSPLRINQQPRMTRYGSIIGSPPRPSQDSGSLRHELRPASTLDLPMPSLDPSVPKEAQPRDLSQQVSVDPDYDRPVSPTDRCPPPLGEAAHASGLQAHEVQPSPSDRRPSTALPSRLQNLLARQPHRSASASDVRPLATRLFGSMRLRRARDRYGDQDIPLEEHRDLDFKMAQFFLFLDKELLKIEGFYKEKEDESVDRLETLRSQLHTMRDQRANEVTLKANGHRHHSTVSKFGHRKAGKTSRYMANLATPSLPALDSDIEPRNTAEQDYVRRNHPVPYPAAKRKLKHAFQELYRGLELLKSYSMVNRTAFRKIDKKYNKSVALSTGDESKRETLQHDYMGEKVKVAHFVMSEVPEKLMSDIEDLYARYFERGNRKLAVGKLRAKPIRASDYSGSMYRAGILQGVGFSLGIVGVVYAALAYYSLPDGSIKQTQISYLLQLYGGYFAFLSLSFLFILDAWVFEQFHVNYPFIFELDTRTLVNWRQVSELPSALACMLGICMCVNFSEMADNALYLYWPVILITLSVFLLFAPIPRFFYARSRKWLAMTLWRLLFSGFYSVEFRDFFLGDMFCSQTYAMGNVELFFCIYKHGWNNPGQCNSGSSRLLGFFSALPGVWRALQCARRYRDTLDWYPHLANMGKYTFTILQYMTLSVWRVNEHSTQLKGLFIACASINSIYCILWDIFNDWSLSPRGLRRTLAYRKHKWWYYCAMVEDAILRFVWLGYVIFPRDYQVQHSSIISFMIAMLEIGRRGVWVIFRVENEHCNNVEKNRAVKDTDLPYPEPPGAEVGTDRPDQVAERIDGLVETPGEATATSSQLERQPSGVQSVRRRQTSDSPVAKALKRVGSTVLHAHAQDYERRRPSAVEEAGSDDDDDDDDSDPDG